MAADHQAIGGRERFRRPIDSAGSGAWGVIGTGSTGDSTRLEMATPRRLKELAPDRVAAAVAADPRLIVPIGTCDSLEAHLPVGSHTIYVDRLADDLSAQFSVLRAPTIEYGVSAQASHGAAPAGSVRKKTLHLLLSDLLASWEHAGIREFILLTASADDAHQEALATVTTLEARVRVVDASPAHAFSLLAGPAGPPAKGEAETSLMLYLAPHLVDLRLVQEDTARDQIRRPIPGHHDAHDGGAGLAVSGATAERGAALYEHIRRRIGERIFAPPSTAVGAGRRRS
jgi:creatinine amidohydrolase/Fe(II)-dependent formamide hydrolase-like protein